MRHDLNYTALLWFLCNHLEPYLNDISTCASFHRGSLIDLCRHRRAIGIKLGASSFKASSQIIMDIRDALDIPTDFVTLVVLARWEVLGSLLA